MDNKPWYEKIYIWIGIFAGVCTIVGFFIHNNQPPITDENNSINLEDNDINTGNQSPVINGGGDITINYGNVNQDSDLNSKSNGLPSSENNMQETYEDNKEDNVTQKTNRTEERYCKGTITKTGWESEYFRLRYANPEGMSMSTEEELDEMNKLEEGTPSIIFSPYELGYAKLTTVYEMMSMADDQSIFVGVCAERLIDGVDISQFIEEFESQMYRNPFVNYTLISDDETVNIGNDDYIVVSYMAESNNVFRYQDNYFRVVGDRVIMIVLNFNDERVRDNVLNAFTAY